MAKRFHQTPNIDFKETFSLIIKASTIKVILTMVASMKTEYKAKGHK